ncbi:unnamed protein product [Polarella glacialis]|uniref:Uncharacterized protein n=1 Tax=Polarella glacialis TaxID=89957 RepID=A0A813J5U4_POLGL|nr:unnamed protein product [Polarella glacialis]
MRKFLLTMHSNKIGHWLFLTQHCLVLQAIHVALSLLASAAELESLQRLTDGLSLFVGALGCFVTVQYFALVHRHPDFKELCATLAQRSPPYDLSKLMIALHVPALPLAFLDIGFAKSHQVLATDISIAGTAWMCLGYVCFYVTLIAANHRATGEWPYGVLEGLGGSLPKWAAFIAAQTVILYVFGIILFGMSRVPDSWTWPST